MGLATSEDQDAISAYFDRMLLDDSDVVELLQKLNPDMSESDAHVSIL